MPSGEDALNHHGLVIKNPNNCSPTRPTSTRNLFYRKEEDLICSLSSIQDDSYYRREQDPIHCSSPTGDERQQESPKGDNKMILQYEKDDQTRVDKMAMRVSALNGLSRSQNVTPRWQTSYSEAIQRKETLLQRRDTM